jgi:DNA-binding response OmpR family regulator
LSNKILVIDDDVALTKTIERILTDAEYDPVFAHTAEDGVRLVQEQRPDLILLDVMIPHMGGWAVCQTVRQFTATPIIFLTALGDVENIVKGLELGADDYMVKPFDRAEFLARIKAHLRRNQVVAETKSRFDLGDGALIVDTAAHTVTVQDKPVELTPREFDLLRALASQAGQVVPTADLVKEAWSMTDRDALDNIKPYIHYLRKKIEADPAAPRWIKTVRGIGYRLVVE